MRTLKMMLKSTLLKKINFIPTKIIFLAFFAYSVPFI